MKNTQADLAAVVGRIELALQNPPEQESVADILRRIEALLLVLAAEIRALRNGKKD